MQIHAVGRKTEERTDARRRIVDHQRSNAVDRADQLVDPEEELMEVRGGSQAATACCESLATLRQNVPAQSSLVRVAMPGCIACFARRVDRRAQTWQARIER